MKKGKGGKVRIYSRAYILAVKEKNLTEKEITNNTAPEVFHIPGKTSSTTLISFFCTVINCTIFGGNIFIPSFDYGKFFLSEFFYSLCYENINYLIIDIGFHYQEKTVVRHISLFYILDLKEPAHFHNK